MSFFGKLLKGLGSALGAIIGGPIGAAVGAAVSWSINRYVFGDKDAPLRIFGATIFTPQDYGLVDKSNGMNLHNLTLKPGKDVNALLAKKLKPWLTKLVKRINGNATASDMQSKDFVDKFNYVLKSLHYAEMYYRYKSKEKNDLSYFYAQKSEIIVSVITGIREAMYASYKDKNLVAKVKKYTLTSDYKVDTPEKFDFNKKVSTTIELLSLASDAIDPSTISDLEDQSDNEIVGMRPSILDKIDNNTGDSVVSNPSPGNTDNNMNNGSTNSTGTITGDKPKAKAAGFGGALLPLGLVLGLVFLGYSEKKAGEKEAKRKTAKKKNNSKHN